MQCEFCDIGLAKASNRSNVSSSSQSCRSTSGLPGRKYCLFISCSWAITCSEPSLFTPRDGTHSPHTNCCYFTLRWSQTKILLPQPTLAYLPEQVGCSLGWLYRHPYSGRIPPVVHGTTSPSRSRSSSDGIGITSTNQTHRHHEPWN